MKTHYFQRYYKKENVDTANTMLLLSRLYSFSPNKFFNFLSEFIPEDNTINLSFNLQKKNKNSIPDAIIEQQSFKIVVETKLNSNFKINQLIDHLKSFKNEDYKVLLTIDPGEIKENIQIKIKKEIDKYNKQHKCNIIHKHITFEKLIDSIRKVIDSKDYEMNEILDDYQDYCFLEKLILDDWKRMRVQLSSQSFEINKKLNLYYCNDRGFSGHKYLGLYKDKSVKAIGKVTSIITATYENNKLLTENKINIDKEKKKKILQAIEEARKIGHDLTKKSQYFFVDKFYDTDFKKITPHAPMGTRCFNLYEILKCDKNKLPSTEEIAKLLRDKNWE